MARRKKVDYKKLLKTVEAGTPQNEIMQKFGFKNSTQLKVAFANAAMEFDVIPKLVGGRRGRSAKAVTRNVKVNSRGSLIVPKQLVDSLGQKPGAEFEVRKSKAGLSLKRV